MQASGAGTSRNWGCRQQSEEFEPMAGLLCRWRASLFACCDANLPPLHLLFGGVINGATHCPANSYCARFGFYHLQPESRHAAAHGSTTNRYTTTSTPPELLAAITQSMPPPCSGPGRRTCLWKCVECGSEAALPGELKGQVKGIAANSHALLLGALALQDAIPAGC